jgi:hypothetical protein
LVRTQGAVFRDGGGDALDGELGRIVGGVRSVIELARELMQFDFQKRTMRQAEMFIAQAIHLRVEQWAEFSGIG